MATTKETVSAFFSKLCSGDFAGGFDTLSEDSTWTIIGDTPLSRRFTKQTLLSDMIPMLSTFKEPAKMAVDDIIAEGDRAAVIANVHGVGPHGPYDQHTYCFICRVKDDRIVTIVEYLDTVAVETALVGSKIVRPS
ncbi:nuclear transport factor 2 family protein [Sphingomonas profundi]|uniref:nuclear transport factor 2 family protein n=1 Tax=Alterirhizorhabdus profundi TaxID=2681549 RepID=UPI0018D1F6B3|nr:nuclear transport factor 2 family protein [Sphingomonas profundi]